jgi:hypothetical protein
MVRTLLIIILVVSGQWLVVGRWAGHEEAARSVFTDY